MGKIYMGVDIAGAKNTWVCGMIPTPNGLELCLPPKISSLNEIVEYAEENPVVAVAIDAQLTSSIYDENGFRSSDIQLRAMLPNDFRVWIASQNSLAAVPTRGRQLSEALSPIVGTIIETHPRACLYLADPIKNRSATKFYKEPNFDYFLLELLDHWGARFNINLDLIALSDGALDAIVCATIAYLFHNEPAQLLKLKYQAQNKRGRGPFYVINPEKLVL